MSLEPLTQSPDELRELARRRHEQRNAPRAQMPAEKQVKHECDTLAVKRLSEKDVQLAVRRLLAMYDVAVYDTSQPFRAKITPGVPDLICFSDSRGLFFVECKAPNGRQSPAQKQFQVLCEMTGVPYLLGGLDVVLAFLNRPYGAAAPAQAPHPRPREGLMATDNTAIG